MFIEDPTFPEAISFHARGGPAHRTIVTETDGEWEYRNSNIQYARRKYVVSFDARIAHVFLPLQPFFAVAEGRLHGFRFKDWKDYRHNDAGGTGIVVAIDATHWYLGKRYVSGSNTKDRLISKPRTGAVIVGSGSYTLDYTTGIITKSSGSAPTGWTGTFDVPCRFDTDDDATEIIDKSHGEFILGWPDIQLQEIRV